MQYAVLTTFTLTFHSHSLRCLQVDDAAGSERQTSTTELGLSGVNRGGSHLRLCTSAFFVAFRPVCTYSVCDMMKSAQDGDFCSLSSQKQKI